MIPALLYALLTVAFVGRIIYLLDGFGELSFQHDRAEVLRVARGTSGLYTLVSAVLMTFLPLSVWCVVIFGALGAALVLSAIGGRGFGHNTVDCNECGSPRLFQVTTIEHAEQYADALFGDVVLDTSTRTNYIVGLDGLRRVEVDA